MNAVLQGSLLKSFPGQTTPARLRVHWLGSLVAFVVPIVFLTGYAWPQAALSQPPAAMSVEDQVLQNILQQPVGNHTIGDFNMPESFLRRVADRIIRSSFEERYRIVVRSPLADARGTAESPGPSKALDELQQTSAPASGWSLWPWLVVGLPLAIVMLVLMRLLLKRKVGA